jgi:hypothetical protein
MSSLKPASFRISLNPIIVKKARIKEVEPDTG